jgi:hypothetical protein
MKNPAYQSLRYFHFLLFFSTSVGKLLDNRGFSEVIATYFPQSCLNRFSSLPEILLAVALLISFLELGLSFEILYGPPVGRVWAGLRLRPSLVCLAVNFAYLSLAVTSLARGLTLKNCGCFGVFWARPLTFETVIEDTILVALSAAYFSLSLTYARGKAVSPQN